MKCNKCGYKNIIKANYCLNCKNKFTDMDRNNAYKKTIYYKIEMLKKWYDNLSFGVITNNIIFKIIFLLAILAVGIGNLFAMGLNTKLLASDNYQIYFNKDKEEYYLVVDDNIDKVNINLYIPNRLKELSVIHYDNNKNLLDETEYKENIILKTYNDDYYLLKSKYSENNMEYMKIIVLKNKDLNLIK